MKIGKYKVSLNYGILKGFVDVMGLLVLYLIYQITYVFIDKNINPDVVLSAMFKDGVPLQWWLPGLIFPLIAILVTVWTVVFMFKKHKAPKRYIITEENAQKYYDTIMIANSLLRILVLLSLWDYTYIHQINLLMGKVSWFSTLTILNVLVAALVIYITNERIKSFAKKCGTETEKEENEKQKSEEKSDGKVTVKVKSDDEDIMRG